MASLRETLTTYYRKKKIRRVYAARLFARMTDPRDRKTFVEGLWKRRFLAAMGALFLALPASGVAMRILGPLHAPEWLDLPITVALLVSVVEGADRDWLKRFSAENQSDFLVLRGLTGIELDAIEDATLLPIETASGLGRALAPAWKAIGRTARVFLRMGLRYWPATLYAAYRLTLGS